jgi:diadenosine tetraphosphate (Ap4A) HIT family hydrolase
MSFRLHPRLESDTAFIADWALSRVVLLDDARFPWVVLVPRRAGLSEPFDLEAQDRALLAGEIDRAARNLKLWARENGGCDKINVGILGNLVPQLHVHVVARRIGDAAWPGPVWGAGHPAPYGEPARVALAARLAATL